VIIWPELNGSNVGLVVVADIKNCHKNPKVGHFFTFYQLLTTTPTTLKGRVFVEHNGGNGREVCKTLALISGTYLQVQAFGYFSLTGQLVTSKIFQLEILRI
jgi:hypothetical protein